MLIDWHIRILKRDIKRDNLTDQGNGQIPKYNRGTFLGDLRGQRNVKTDFAKGNPYNIIAMEMPST